jgi:hypothetical protein
LPELRGKDRKKVRDNMANIELVIRIPEEDYKRGTVMASAIRNGIPLPKGHGRLIDADELLKAMDTWDKFGNVPNAGLIPFRTLALQDIYVPYVKYGDMVNCVKGMPSVTPQEPKTKGSYHPIISGNTQTPPKVKSAESEE